MGRAGGIMGSELDAGKVAFFVEGTEADASAEKGAIDDGKEGLGRVIDKDFYRSGMDIALQPNGVPIEIGKRCRRFAAGDAASRRAINKKDAVVDRMVHTRIPGEVGVVEVHWIDVVEDHDYGFLA